MVTHLEPNILKHEVKYTLGKLSTIKDSGGDGMSGEEFKILKYDAVKYNILANIENSNGLCTGKGIFSFKSQIRSMPKKVQEIVKFPYNCSQFTC